MNGKSGRRLLAALWISLVWGVDLHGQTITAELVVSGLTRPVFVTASPDDPDRLFILEKAGVIQIYRKSTMSLNVGPFLDIDAIVGGGNSDNSEQGLLGMAFHPDYETNGFFYLNYTSLAGDTRIVRYTRTASPDKADPNSEELILFVDQPFSNHNTGWLDFGPDGFLYVPLGDGGSACDPGQRAQDITNQLLGKMMRLDVDGPDAFPGDPNKNYAIPADNPFVGIAGDDEIWAYGLRNPWRDSFDRGTGDLYIADVGQNLREEVNFQMAGDAGGRNYGWDCEEGFICANLSPQCNGSVNGCTCGQAGITDPIHDYTHASGRCSISGGYVYRGCDIPEEEGNYFFADFCSGQVWSMPAGGGAVTERTALFPAGVATISSFGEDFDGELYIVDQGSSFPPVTPGEIWKITRSPALTDADIDRDGDKDVADADLLADVLLGIGIFDACTLQRADVNGDGNRDGLDIQSWIDTP